MKIKLERIAKLVSLDFMILFILETDAYLLAAGAFLLLTEISEKLLSA